MKDLEVVLLQWSLQMLAQLRGRSLTDEESERRGGERGNPKKWSSRVVELNASLTPLMVEHGRTLGLWMLPWDVNLH